MKRSCPVFLGRSRLRFCIFTYHFLLASGGQYAGIWVITNFTLHYFIPLAVVINWFLFESKKMCSYKCIFYWVVYPVLYCIISIVRGYSMVFILISF
ncbi:Pr6Pr family membrane protein [Oceanobacillus sp. FSL W8-0428]|uniref:Pr6Pr family membrane protein n=1 Tax=Oceanobacillus sp. FSL W8-0428 TaxID=2921715 RepID=UPI004046B622